MDAGHTPPEADLQGPVRQTERKPQKTLENDPLPGNEVEPSPRPRSKLKSSLRLVALLALLAAAAYGYLAYSEHAALYPSTNDAQLGANVIRIAPQVGGTVQQVAVASFAKVKKGDLLFSIDPAPYQAALDRADAQLELARQQAAGAAQAVDAAKSNLDAQKAVLANARQSWQRVDQLVAQGTMAQSAADAQRSALTQAEASVRAATAELNKARATLGNSTEENPAVLAAEAAVRSAKLQLSYTRVYAPEDGVLGTVTLRPGSLATPNGQAMQLVDTRHWWADANFKETDLARIRKGEAATVEIDLLPGVAFKGKVEALSPASGAAFSLFPPNNATGNWVKVTQRFPVRVAFDAGQNSDRLRIGASATVTVDTSGVAR